MSEAQRERLVLQILGEALGLTEGAREAFLDRACGTDGELRQELEELLAEHLAGDDGFLEVPAVFVGGELQAKTLTQSQPTTRAPTAPTRPERLGPYRVVGELGRGGMGCVYLGEQEKPIRRRVALKVIDAIHDDHGARRFAAECQAQAHLSHPNVASLYEVGATEGDQPFVAMELIEGSAITDWCDQHQVSLRQRIELFFGVCAGVRHAHEKGILHRDIKPSNVLVTEVDGQPMAKVIDFGIARALDEPLLADSPRLTREHQIVGSPAFMSPEMVFGERDVDTRSDVYALGIVLYELLAGILPFDLREQSLAVLLGSLAKGTLPAPSQRFAELEPEQREDIARRRKLSESKLRQRLSGDLDAIIKQAIAYDREQRYSSPADLAADLERHLAIQPVTARPPALPYLLGRYLRRRAGSVSALAALILAMAAGIVVSTREARRANREAELAMLAAQRSGREARRARLAQAEGQEVLRFVVDLFEVADPERDPQAPVDVRQLLETGAERLRHELVDQPLARARLLHTISDIYTKLARFEQAEDLAVEALELREAELAADHSDLLASVNQLGIIYRHLDRLDEAEILLRRVLDAQQGASLPQPLRVAKALNNLGNLLWRQRRFDEAEALHRQALKIREREPGPVNQDLGQSLNNLGIMLKDLQRYEEAVPYLQRADEIFSLILGTEHPVRAAGLNNLGMVEHQLGLWQASETHLRQAAASWQASYGEQHPRTINARINLGRLWLDMGREAQASKLLSDVLRIQESTDAPERRIASTSRSLGIALGRLGDFESAETALQHALSIYRETRGEDASITLRSRSDLAWLAWCEGRFSEAEAEHRRILEIRERIHGSEDVRVASSLHSVALALLSQGQDEEAEPLLRRALYIREAARGMGDRTVGKTLLELGELVRRTGRQQEARRLLSRAVDIYQRVLPPDHRELQRAIEALDSLSLSSLTSP